MKRKFGILALSLALAVSACFGGSAIFSVGAYAAGDATDEHGWSRTVNSGAPVDVKANTETGYSSVQMIQANGAYNTKAISVAAPFRIGFSYSGLGSDWGPAILISRDLGNANHFSGSGAKPVIGANSVAASPKAWNGAVIQFCMPKNVGESPVYLMNAASCGFYNGTTGNYDAALAKAVMQPNVKANPGSSYDYYFDIQDEIGNSAQGTGSKLVLTETKADGTTAQDTFYLEATRASFSANKGYVAVAAVGHGTGYAQIKLAKQSQLMKSVGSAYSLAELTVGGEDQSTTSGFWNAFYGDPIRFKVTGSDPLVKLGTKAILPDSQGYYNGYMADAQTVLSVAAVTGTYYDVTYETDGGSYIAGERVAANGTAKKPVSEPSKPGFLFGGWYSDSACSSSFDFTKTITANTKIYAKWTEEHTVTYTLPGFRSAEVKVAAGDKVSAFTVKNMHYLGSTSNKATYTEVDSLKLDWYSDAGYAAPADFTKAVTADVTLYGKLSETKQYKDTRASGWDALSKTKDSANTTFLDTNFARAPFDILADGSAVYNLTSRGSFGIYSRGLDVTKPIKIDLTMTSGLYEGWFMVSFFDKLTVAQLSEANGYSNNNSGSFIGFGIDPTTGKFLPDAITVPTLAYGDQIKSYSMNKKVEFVVTIGKTAAESSITINGEKAFTLNVKQSDFDGGLAYLNVSAFEQAQAEINVTQTISATAAGEHGSVTFRQVGSYLIAKPAADSGYKFDKLLLNGKEVKVDSESPVDGLLQDGEYLVYADSYRDAAFTAAFTEKGSEGNEPGGKTGCGTVGFSGGSGLGLGLAASALAGLTFVAVRKRQK